MSIPKEPRQQMINMMYLVLTAMLALNITKEVLNAFQTINQSIERSNDAISGKNAALYAAFDKAQNNPSEADKVRPYNDRAKKVKAYTDELYSYLNSLKDSVINRAGGKDVNAEGDTVVKSIENIDASPQFFYKLGYGDSVKNRLIKYKDDILSLIPPGDTKNSLDSQFPVQVIDPKPNEDNPKGEWSFGTFNNIPVVAAVAMLSKFQNDIKNAEAMALEDLQKRIYLEDYKFDTLAPIAVPTTSYALEGQEIEANITLAAFNKTLNPDIFVGGQKIEVKGGVGIYKTKASGIGEREVTGQIVMDKQGKKETYPFKFKYMVGSAGASMGLDKMNVMYIGVDNPVTLSASGYNIQDVDLVVPDGVTKKPVPNALGKYNLEVTKKGPMVYQIKAKNRDGSIVTLLSDTIRVKEIPDPSATLMKKKGGPLPTASVRVQMGLIAEVENFEFATRFVVTEFRFLWIPKVGDAYPVFNKGAKFGKEIVDILKRVQPGDQILFSEIKAVGPDKKVRDCPPLVFTLR